MTSGPAAIEKRAEEPGDAPRVTVLTATFNRAHVLAGAIRSVLEQELESFEYLIVDDGSTDATAEIVDHFTGDTRVRMVSTPNRGQAAALNLGLSLARAPLVGFLDSDDELLPDHLSRLARLVEERGLDFVLGRFQAIVANGEPDPRVRDFYHPGRTIPLGRVECVTGALLGRRNAFLCVGGFRPGFAIDTDMFDRLKRAGCRWARAAVPTYRYHFGRCADSLAIAGARAADGRQS